ncbi:MAG: FecR domain-containing protein [Rhodothermaceae bacterium]|nr:FecR domain-containing protein [Rhodothermaceae bacterium]
MREPLELLALYDALGPAERAEVEHALRDNPALADAFQRWRSLRAAVRRELAEALPDRALLVLYALSDEALPDEAAPHTADALSVNEHRRLAAARGDLRALLAKHPGLVDAVRRIRDDRDAFERIWATHTERNGQADAPRPSPARADDRPAVLSRRPVRRRSPVWRVAALASVVAFAAILTFIVRRDAGWETVRVAETTTVDLPDGSTAELAANTWLMVPDADGSDLRQARLRAGRALFTVRHDPADPFTVETPNALVTVLGTTFGLDVTDVETEVVLVTGAVALASRAETDAPVRLEPGQRSRVLALEAPSAPARADLDAALDWTGDVFVPSESLARMALRLSEAFAVDIEVDPTLADEELSATHFEREAGARAALDELALALSARVAELPEGGFRIEAEP